LEPSASVSIVARRHDLNANQLFKWRREMALKEATAMDESVAMLSVEIVSERSEPPPRARRIGTIEISFACGARVCVHGEVSPDTLEQVIALLR
jgi:transposase